MLLNLRRLATFHLRVPILYPPTRLLSTLPLSLSSSPDDTTLDPNPLIKPLTNPELKALIFTQYRQGKFYNLVQNVIASPSVLLTACQNLTTAPHSNAPNSLESLTLSSVSTHFFSIQELADELRKNRFDVESCCVSVPPPPRKKGESFVLPNLKLKVVIEAIRMVLEVVYDDRLATFAYGGRVGMGRHTAIRYLKNSVENPSWWFTVSFDPELFDFKHVDKLCLIVEDKIKDELLINIIKRLFKSQAVRIQLGGCYLGRGFPQESSLSSILINIYLNRFDKEIQELRLQMNRENPKFDSSEIVSSSGNAFYKPLKMYAVRYFDEILVITSGSKMLTMDLKKRVLKILVTDLELKVDRVRTAIHSAVSEKIDFLGMELRAVTPSVLHPPMSQKAIRARKKYLRQKEVRAIELRNARETNRKKLGMKVMSNVFKKLKRGDGFKFDLQIEKEVREIFRTWADEAVQEFLGSLEECWNWHRHLSAGDFLSLRRIRDQLPQELVDAYDNFQEQVDKHLKPVKARKELAEEERRIEEEEERRYAERTVEDLTKLCMKVDAPIELVRKAVKMAGFTNHMGRPRPINSLMALEDTDIIKWYAGVGRRWLDFFCCCHNFKSVKTVVTYHLRFSCLLTLAEKHESTKREAIRHYSKDLKVSAMNGAEEVYFPTEKEIKMMGDSNLSDPKPVDGALTTALIRLATNEPAYRCVAHFCNKTDTIVYRIRLLQSHLNVDPLDEKRWVLGMGVIHESLNRKCLPLCADHISDLYMGTLTLQDIDCTSFMDVD
ncbi:nuclear intron maturase 3, mitochondrial [Cornus florida]|uniref:nuclear intron maturase 3, mitochondrial n=1 Tax=Cornus florida TaxID=4283 RepID=UPI0028A06C76|nr:nuclear intron maturase 3, mitochondrial [Cornus florida]XP_059668353.1 nuclear intron maturase 3, mitochondrial [Cornus florida]XP_059668354.1 nuclear intron maturase 3, mitochondrial [Cornus florida]XP_059668355.1 nuclear intron maturase 3, mitochondrial [Cornus florida]